MKEIPISTYLVRVKKVFPFGSPPKYMVQFKTNAWYRRWHYHLVDNGLDTTPYWTHDYDKALIEAKMVHSYLNEKDGRRRYTYIS